jgi:hypothetical protein
MATRSQQFHAEEERRQGAKNRKRAKANAAPKARARSKKGRTETKAPYALEPEDKGARPSRKSSRKSANHAKPDASFNMVEQLSKTSPEARFRKERARNTKVRGKSSRP